MQNILNAASSRRREKNHKRKNKNVSLAHLFGVSGYRGGLRLPGLDHQVVDVVLEVVDPGGHVVDSRDDLERKVSELYTLSLTLNGASDLRMN